MGQYRLRTKEELAEKDKDVLNQTWYTNYMDRVWEIDDEKVKAGNTYHSAEGFGYAACYLIKVEEDMPILAMPEVIEEPMPNFIEERAEYPELAQDHTDIFSSLKVGDVEKEPTLTEAFKEFAGVEEKIYANHLEATPMTDLELNTDDCKNSTLSFTVFCKAKDLSKRIEEVKMIIEATLNSGEEGKFLKARL